jgi:hypothetical protein
VYWLTHVGLKADGASGVTDYLAKFPSGKHAAEAQSILMEKQKVPGTILVVSATYGAACGVPKGNDTVNLASQCNGHVACTYNVGSLGSDPALGCEKDYAAQYRCSNESTLRLVNHGPVRQHNDTYPVVLDCTPK